MSAVVTGPDPVGRGSVDLYWIPLGAGASVVRLSGRLFEAASGLVHRRRRCDLFHSALVVDVPAGRFVIEMTPVPDGQGAHSGLVVAARDLQPAGRPRSAG